MKDPKFKVFLDSAYQQPNKTIYRAARRDYSEVLCLHDNPEEYFSIGEEEAGEWIIKKLIPFGHFGPLEHVHMTFEISGFPHSTLMQMRTHRISTWDIQSQRYTGKRVMDLVKLDREFTEKYSRVPLNVSASEEEKDIVSFIEALDDVFYVRPVGDYVDRQGQKYTLTDKGRKTRLLTGMYPTAVNYVKLREQGVSEEEARGVLASEVRQGCYVTLNIRSLMHILDMRSKKDAQLECQWLCEGLFDIFKEYTPEIANWYEEKRLGKNKLAP